MHKIAVAQSNYIPWKGYFDMIRQVDTFILFDTDQYVPRSWRNRNRIKMPSGLKWLTIPVHHQYQQPKRICDTYTVDNHWRKKHWKNITQHYHKANYFSYYQEQIERLYLGNTEQNLSQINFLFITEINKILEIETPVIRLTDFHLKHDRDGDMMSLCREYGATHYLSGPLAKQWIDKTRFAKEGITVEWMNYSYYPEYPQFHPPFEHATSVLDLIFHTGPEAKSHLNRSNKPPVTTNLEHD